MKGNQVSGLLAAVLSASALHAATVDETYRIVLPDLEKGSIVWNALHDAAEGLRQAVKEATGLSLPVTVSSAATGKGFYLGSNFAARDGLDAKGMSGWQNAYSVKDGSIYFYGARDYTGYKETPGWSWAHGILPSIRAEARFMEDVMGVRFVMPGQVGMEVPKRAAIELKEGLVSSETPRVTYGANLNRNCLHSIANQCFGAGNYKTYGGHLYPIACPFDKYAKTHPEYFGLCKSGRRYCDEPGAKSGWAPLCFTNPEVEQLIIDELCRQFDAGADVCQLAPGDSGRYCECEKCQNYGGLKDNPGTLHSEQIWLFHRHIAERMLKERPGKIVHILSYGPTHQPPRDFRTFPPNVMIEACDSSEENLKRWKDWGTVPHGITVYTYLWGEYYREGFTAKHSLAHLAEAGRRFMRYGVHGLFRCGYGELWGTEGPGYYVFNRMLRNPEEKVAAVFTEYLEAAYGPAAKPMRIFHETLDRKLAILDAEKKAVIDVNAGDGFMAKPKKINVESIGSTWDEATVRTMEKQLAAARATEGLSDKQRRRLALVATEFAYAKETAAVCRNYLAFRASPSEKTVKPTIAAIRRREKVLDAIYGTGERPKPIPGWPEVEVFGWHNRAMLARNGRSGGRIEEPLSWDVGKILSDYDVSGWKRKDKANAALKRLTEWRLSGGHKAEKFEVRDGLVHFVAAGEKPDVRIQASYKGLIDLKPGTKCRLSWQVKMKDMKPVPTSRWGGEGKVNVWYGAKFEENAPAPIVSYELASTDWVRQSVEVTLTGDPKTRTEVSFRILERTGEFWIRDVAIEEVE